LPAGGSCLFLGWHGTSLWPFFEFGVRLSKWRFNSNMEYYSNLQEGARMSDYYYDDPIEEAPARSRRIPTALASILILLAAGLFVKTTLAANISINTGVPAEFGQGISVAAACSGASVLTMTPVASFTNASGAGAFYFTSVTVSGIPASCNGVDFNISAYNTIGNALPIFNTSSTVAPIWDNSGYFQGGHGFAGSSVASAAGAFTVTFTSPVALASNVAKLTLQSVGHASGNCATENICAVGDTGPGGGTVFYVGASFTETGTVCNTNCHYLELAPLYWYSNPEPVGTLAPTSGGSLPSTTPDTFGAGWSNTNFLSSYSSSGSGVYAAVRYGSSTGTVGQWFIPSTYEMDALYNSSVNTQLTPDFYWTSTYRGANAGAEYGFPKGYWSGYTMPYYGGYFNNPHSMRAIRAF